MREKRFSVRALVLTVVLTVLLTAVLLAGILCLLLGKEGMSMAQAMVLINTQFVGEHDIGEAVDGAMDSLITGLGDRWSYYMDAEGYARQKENKSNAYVGLGCTVSYPETEGLLIEAVTEDGPADKAGLKAGDLILEIDGVRMEGEARSRATEYTRGPDGSEAELLIQRADGIEQRFKVVRAEWRSTPYPMSAWTTAPAWWPFGTSTAGARRRPSLRWRSWRRRAWSGWYLMCATTAAAT